MRRGYSDHPLPEPALSATPCWFTQLAEQGRLGHTTVRPLMKASCTKGGGGSRDEVQGKMHKGGGGVVTGAGVR